MHNYLILKTFPGSQTGNDYHVFTAGEVHLLSPDLARIAVSQGWAERHIAPAAKAEERETKVEEPEEIKDDEAPKKKRKS